MGHKSTRTKAAVGACPNWRDLLTDCQQADIPNGRDESRADICRGDRRGNGLALKSSFDRYQAKEQEIEKIYDFGILPQISR